MKNRTLVGAIVAIGGALAICLVGVVGFLAYQYLQAPDEASGPLEAVPIEAEATDAPAETVTEPDDQTDNSDAENDSVTDTEDNDNEVADEPENDGEEVTSAPKIYTIQQSASEVRFELDEDLRGNRITVVGTTNQVAGQISIDYANVAATQLGVIQVNARTILTDNDFRNRAINNQILETGFYEFITFTPTELVGLPDSISIGETVSFDVVGDLTIRDITNTVTFAVTVTAVSDSEISGTATTTVTREMYNLSIPSVPAVANVEDEVELYIDFVATTE